MLCILEISYVLLGLCFHFLAHSSYPFSNIRQGVATLALRSPYGCLSASDVTLEDIGKK